MADIPLVQMTPAGAEAAAIDALVLAFAADPMARWCMPGAREYLEVMPRFARAFGGAAFARGSAYCTDDFGGAALWLPPDVHVDEPAVAEVLAGAVRESIQADLFAVFEQMAKYHPAEPHWYLPLIGVDPAHQARGYGGALMRHALERCDREHRVAYLESSNPRNISLYQRHGFEILGTIQQGASPEIVPMLRSAR